jgi:hypothetical protein
MARRPTRDTTTPDPRLVRALHGIVIAGFLLVLALPAARGHSQWLGALPLWLLAMPLSSLWALHGFRLPRLRAKPAIGTIPRRRRSPQARRRSPARLAPALPRAA